MCGRYSESEKLEVIEERCDLQIDKKYKPNYNASSGNVLPVITNKDPKNLTFMQSTRLPHWSKERKIKYSTFHAKAEELTCFISRKYILQLSKAFKKVREISIILLYLTSCRIL